MYSPRYAMFFDNHTQKACPDVGHEYNAGRFAEALANAGVDFIGFHAKCNQGLCYFNTKVGTRHPSLPAGMDLFGDTVRACSERGIGVSAYLNCGLSNETAIEHPEWNKISPEGRQLHFDIKGMGEINPYLRVMCVNSPYRDYFFALVREIMEQYPVKGFLFDSMNSFPCVCPHCVEGMRKQGMDPRDPKQAEQFAYMSSVRMAEDLAKLLRSHNPEYLHNYLGLTPRDNARIAGYMECECLPTNPLWGYDTLPISARYFRTLKSGPALNMTARFYDWGDFGSLRTAPAVEYDLYMGLANGLRPNIADHFLPSGELNRGMFQRVKEIYDHIRRYERWHCNARNLVDMALVLPQDNSDKSPTLAGAVRLLSELRMQFDIVDSMCDWSKYPVLILPDSIRLNEELTAKLKAYLQQGGKVFATGDSGLDDTGDHFVLEQKFGVHRQGICPHEPAYFRMNGSYAEGMPDLPQAARLPGHCVTLLPGTSAAGLVVKSYFNKHWDGVYSYFYTPPKQETDEVFASVNDQVVYCAFPIFESYYKTASADLRRTAGNLLKHLLPEPLLKVNDCLPSFARVFVTESDCGCMVHLLNYVPELRGEMLIVEEEVAAVGVEVSLRWSGTAPRQVTLAPDGTAVSFTLQDGYLHFKVPEFSGYALIVCQ